MDLHRTDDIFQSLILREVVLAEGLQDDMQKAELAGWLGEVLAQPASLALDSLVRYNTNGILTLPKELTKKAIIGFFQQHRVLYAIRAGRGQLSRLFRDREHTAHSYCRTALCYAVQGYYAEAESWLRDAEKLVGDLARMNFIRGLMHGAQKQLDEAEAKLKESLNGRAKKVTKERIAEALAVAGRIKERSEDKVKEAAPLSWPTDLNKNELPGSG